MTSEDDFGFALSSSPPPMDSPPSILNSTHQDPAENYAPAFMHSGEPSTYDLMTAEQQDTMYGQDLSHDATPPTLSNSLINTPLTTTAQSSPSTNSLTYQDYASPMYNGNLNFHREDTHLVQPMANPYVTSAPRAGTNQQPTHFGGYGLDDGGLQFSSPNVSLPRVYLTDLTANSSGLSGSGNIGTLGDTHGMPYRTAAYGDVEARNRFGTANYPGEPSTSGYRHSPITNSPGTPNFTVHTRQSGRRMPNTTLAPQSPYVSPYEQPEYLKQEYPDIEMPVQTRAGARQATAGQALAEDYVIQFRSYNEAEAHRFWYDDSAFRDTNGHAVPNPTLPDPVEYIEIVQELFNSIYDIDGAKDNEGMIKPWGPDGAHRKNPDTLVLVEKACWKLLNRLIDHCGNGPCTAKFQSIGNPAKQAAKNRALPHFEERLAELNKELKERKSICKRLIAPDYVDQVVDDPTACGKRVQANKQLNKRKADVMAAGKGAMKEKEGNTDGEYDEGDGHDDSGSYGDDADSQTPPVAKKAKNRKVSFAGKATRSDEKPKPKTGGRGSGLMPNRQEESAGRRPTRQGMSSSSMIELGMPIADAQKGQAIGVSNDEYGDPTGYQPYNPRYGTQGYLDHGNPQSGNYPPYHGPARGLNTMNYPRANLHRAQTNAFGVPSGIQTFQSFAPVAEPGPFENQFAENDDMPGDEIDGWQHVEGAHQGDGMKSEYPQQ